MIGERAICHLRPIVWCHHGRSPHLRRVHHLLRSSQCHISECSFETGLFLANDQRSLVPACRRFEASGALILPDGQSATLLESVKCLNRIVADYRDFEALQSSHYTGNSSSIVVLCPIRGRKRGNFSGLHAHDLAIILEHFIDNNANAVGTKLGGHPAIIGPDRNLALENKARQVKVRELLPEVPAGANAVDKPIATECLYFRVRR